MNILQRKNMNNRVKEIVEIRAEIKLLLHVMNTSKTSATYPRIGRHKRLGTLPIL